MVFKDINIKIYTCYFFNDIINIEEFDPNNIKTDKKSNEKKNYFLHCICNYQRSKYMKINSMNHLYIMFNRINGYKYLTLNVFKGSF